ncbi:uncharacterized protein [Eurosta solidaginis]|uniref:uncharacterized protein n=1 Tax=Eurosta solidaginis TaxID=178769 RepID=UPI0035306A22
MSAFFQILFVACLAMVLCNAEAPRYRSRNARLQRNRFLARQEVADAAGVTPYPSAKELIPDVPFDEAAAAAAPALPTEFETQFFADVDSVSVDLPAGQQPTDDEVDETVAADDVAGEREPDLVYGPPEAEDGPTVNDIPVDEIEETIAEEEEQAAAAEEQSERFVSGRRYSARPAKLRAARPAKLRTATPFSARSTSVKSIKSARLVKAKLTNKARPARLQQLQQQPQFFVPQQFAAQQQQQQPIFYYSAAQLQQW